MKNKDTIVIIIVMVYILNARLHVIKTKKPMSHVNIADFNRGQGSKIIRQISEDDNVAFVQKNGKPLAVLISNARYERLLVGGIDINEY